MSPVAKRQDECAALLGAAFGLIGTIAIVRAVFNTTFEVRLIDWARPS